MPATYLQVHVHIKARIKRAKQLKTTSTTMYREGASAQVAREMEGYKLWRISECRWTVPRRMRTASGQTIIYSGNEELHEEGVVIMISRQAVKSLMEWTPISNITITARNYTSCKRVAMIQGYASHNESMRCCRNSEMDATRMTSLSS